MEANIKGSDGFYQIELRTDVTCPWTTDVERPFKSYFEAHRCITEKYGPHIRIVSDRFIEDKP